jgi:hypothetical protein
MAINSRFKILVLTAMFLCGLSVLSAQTAGYFLDPSSEEPRFIQRLAWSGGAYSLHYEVIIEREDSREYMNLMSEFTTGNFIDISLPPGNYRFRIIPYDILDRPSTGTQWVQFKVFKAVRPELYRQEEKTEYTNDKQEYIFVFSGRNLEPDANIYFVSPRGDHIVPVEIGINDDGRKVSLVFNKDQLINGEYEVFVINPGGLQTNLSGINFESPKERLNKTFCIVGVSWIPLYPAYGDGFGDGWTLANICARISLNACLFLNNYMGMEFTLIKYPDSVPNMPKIFIAGYNFLLINWLPSQKMAYNFRAGIGFTTQPLDFNYLNIGVSFLYRIGRNLNIETGIDYSHSFNDSVGGGIQPWIGMSILF